MISRTLTTAHLLTCSYSYILLDLLTRSKSQAVIRFSSPEVTQRVLAALREERRTGRSQKKMEFDVISSKAVRIFVEKMTPEDKKENEKRKE